MPPDGPPGNLTGSLLVAHPNLRDPNFRRTILFLSHHSVEEGAIGLVLNRPLGKSLAEISVSPIPDELEQAPAYYGGPVGEDQLTVASLRWGENPEELNFHSYMGDVDELLLDAEAGVRAFLGYAGWTQGQLEQEIADKAWLVIAPTRELIEMDEPEQAWGQVMRAAGPLMWLLAESPDRPDLN